MNEELQLPELEPYVLSLLAVASEATSFNSKGPAIVENVALAVGLSWVGALPAAASTWDKEGGPLHEWIGHMDSPPSAFHAAATLADAVNQVVRERHPKITFPRPSSPTKFDQHVFLALGQTICGVAGFRNGIGPSAEQTWKKIAVEAPRSLQQRFLRNYLGNVLQDYFDTSHVRAANPKLPRTEEEALRSEDAEDLVEAMFEGIDASEYPIKTELLLQKLGQLLKQVWRAELDLDNDKS